MFCGKCGKEVGDNATFCDSCKSQLNPLSKTKVLSNNDDKVSAWWCVLCFLFPIVGLILYLVWKYELPKHAGICAKAALIRFVSVLFLIICLLSYLGVPGFTTIYAMSRYELLFFSLLLL